MTTLFRLIAFPIISVVIICTSVFAQEEEQPNRVMFTNVNVFDGVSETLDMNTNVLVENNLIKSIGSSITLPEETQVIDGGGRTLLPGFIDNHVHLMLPGPTLPSMEANSTWEDLAIAGVASAEMYLMQGFTTVRDAVGTERRAAACHQCWNE